MKNWLLVSVMVLLLSGCALLTKIAPSQVDEAGNVVPGTHTLTSTAQTGVDVTGPYGQAGAAILLLVWNFVERVKAKKSTDGLKSTLIALKQAADDPETKAAFEQVKAYLKNAHDSAGVRKDIDALLAKI